jgi:hypothetical protein
MLSHGGVVAAAVDLALAAAALTAARIRSPGITLSPDGRRYVALARTGQAPLPFALRWLLPAACGPSLGRWRWCTTVHLALLPALVALWLDMRLDSALACAAGGLLIIGLAGIWRLHLMWPVLVDPTAMTWAVGAAILAKTGNTFAAVASVLVAGAVKEIAPIFAAAYAWNPVLLLGLVAPAIRRPFAHLGPDPEGEDSILDHPLRAGLRAHANSWRDARVMLLPWGVCLLAPLAFDDSTLRLMLLVNAAIAYGQLLVAVDTVRLYQWAAPAFILCVVSAVPTWSLVPLVVLHLLNPCAGDGR